MEAGREGKEKGLWTWRQNQEIIQFEEQEKKASKTYGKILKRLYFRVPEGDNEENKYFKK